MSCWRPVLWDGWHFIGISAVIHSSYWSLLIPDQFSVCRNKVSLHKFPAALSFPNLNTLFIESRKRTWNSQVCRSSAALSLTSLLCSVQLSEVISLDECNTSGLDFFGAGFGSWWLDAQIMKQQNTASAICKHVRVFLNNSSVHSRSLHSQ